MTSKLYTLLAVVVAAVLLAMNAAVAAENVAAGDDFRARLSR